MKQYKLKDHVTDDMLVAVGFRIVDDWQLKAIRENNNGSHTFIDNLSLVVFWNVDDIKDLIELGYVEEMK